MTTEWENLGPLHIRHESKIKSVHTESYRNVCVHLCVCVYVCVCMCVNVCVCDWCFSMCVLCVCECVCPVCVYMYE